MNSPAHVSSGLRLAPAQIQSNHVACNESDSEPFDLEVSVVIPCLNEADTLADCIEVAQFAFSAHQLRGEVVIADNGSLDGSPEIALALGARVIRVDKKGYGNALMGGIREARGKYVIMGDADASYDFSEIPNFVNKLREGFELVQGCRLESGGGSLMPGAMPFLHRYLGNPFFTMLVRRVFRAPINDVNCGLRGFSKELYNKLDQRCTGMEFAVEMVVKASLLGARIGEIPITLHKDGRINTTKHLKTFRDGWRTLRFFMLNSPRWLFLYPGSLLILIGIIVSVMGILGLHIGDAVLDIHTILMGSLMVIIGYQAILFSVSAKIFAITEGLLPPDPKFTHLFRYFTLERGLIAGAFASLAGLGLVLYQLNLWRLTGFGMLDYRQGMRLTIPAVLLLTLGVQTIFGSFFLSIIGLSRKRKDDIEN